MMKSNTHLFSLLAAFIGLISIFNSCNEANADDHTKGSDTAKKKTILFIAGAPSHSNGEHEFRAGCMLLADALNKSGLHLEAKVHYYGWPKDESIFDGVDACVIYADAGGRFKEKYAVLDEKVKDGMGIMFMHYGVHPKKEIGEKYFKPWIGGYMDDHESVNPHWIADLEAIPNEAIARGLPKKFKAYDEFYYHMIFPTKEECDCCRPLVLATPTPERIVKYINMWNMNGENGFGKPQALMWCRDPKPDAGGRGVGFVGGHYHHNWAVDDFRKLVLNSIVWLARMEVPDKGVQSAAITQDMLNANLDRPEPNKPLLLPNDALYEQKPMERQKFDANGKRIRKSRPKNKVKKKQDTPKKNTPSTQQNPSLKKQPSPQNSVSKESNKWAPPVAPAMVDIEHFSTPEDHQLEVTLWAASPMLYNPTNMDIDHAGRIWVAEGVNYRRKANRRKEGDRIVVLEDTDKDGKADKSHTFYQDPSLQCPLGVSVFDNKIVVPMPPNILVFTDVNRDLKFDPAVDKKEILLSGFNALQHDHSLHSVTAGPDGKWYFNNGNCGAIFTDKSGKTFNMNGSYRGGGGKWFTENHKLNGKKSDDGFLWTSGFSVRVNPDGTEAEIIGHGFRNSYEQSINSLGDVFQNDNDDFSGCRNSYILEYGSAGFFTRDGQRDWRSEQRPEQSSPSAHWRQLDPGTFDVGDIYGIGSPTGNVFYENGALGKQWEGSYLACEAAQNTIFGYRPQPHKATFTMNRFDFLTSNKKKNFIGGDFAKKIKTMDQDTDKTILFRPSDVAVGPDGAVYVADWYDGRVGGHATIDDSCSGAIYRIAPKGFKSAIPALDLSTTAGQIEALKSPAVNVRSMGFVLLREQDTAAYEAVVALLSHPNQYIAARAIWLLPYLGEKGLKHSKDLLSSDNETQQIVAYRALRRTLGKIQGTQQSELLSHAKQLASHPSAAIRRDVALSLRHFSAEQTAEIFVELAKHVDINDKNSVEAIGLGAENKENEIWSALKAAQQNKHPAQWSERFAKLTWRLWPTAAVPDLTERALSTTLSKTQGDLAVESLAFIDAPSAADAMLKLADKNSPVKASATYWLLKRGTGSWSKFDIKKQLKERGIYDPSKIVVTEIKVPASPKPSKLPSAKDILALKGDAEKGRNTIMRCVMCHYINGAGPNYGPQLKGWGTTQSRQAIITAILDPSAGIAHGFRGYELMTKDGKTIHGMVTKGDPAIVTSTGGITQMVPKEQIKHIKPMAYSLMLSAEQLGLTAQDIADIASYMQQW